MNVYTVFPIKFHIRTRICISLQSYRKIHISCSRHFTVSNFKKRYLKRSLPFCEDPTSSSDAPNPQVTAFTVLLMPTILQWQLRGWMASNARCSLQSSWKFTNRFRSFQIYSVLVILDIHKGSRIHLPGTLSYLRDLHFERGIFAGCHTA
jgi:hypothetical protein